MSRFTPWIAPALHGRALLAAQRQWLAGLTAQLHDDLQQTAPASAVGACLESLFSGLLQTLVGEEEAFRQLGIELTSTHLDEHNALCLQIDELLRRHERGEAVGAALLERLEHWQRQHCAAEDRLLH